MGREKDDYGINSDVTNKICMGICRKYAAITDKNGKFKNLYRYVCAENEMNLLIFSERAK